mmetsp:Transcript_53139/g.137279  ORF Transcript_53139/g.137279 Transcript_53139/m.137279 type:complete len:340 (-) Transcript_53139:1917-2936(-)
MRRQISGLNLHLRANGTFNAPAHVQAHAKADAAEVRHPRLQGRMRAVYGQVAVAAHLRKHLDEGHHSQVSDLGPQLRLEQPDPPHEQEGGATILVRRAKVLVHHPVQNGRHLVHEDLGLPLQHLCDATEMADVAEAVDGLDLVARYHCIYRGIGIITSEVLDDDLAPRLSEAQRQKGAELDDGILEDAGLQKHHRTRFPGTSVLLAAPPALPAARVTDRHGAHRAQSDDLHQPGHSLDRCQDKVVHIPAEEQSPCGEDHDDERGLKNTKDRLPSHVLRCLEDKDEVPVYLVTVCARHHGRVPDGFLPPELLSRTGNSRYQRDTAQDRASLVAARVPGLH